MPSADLRPLVTIGVIVIIVAAGLLGFYVYSNYDSIFGIEQSVPSPLANPANTSATAVSVDNLFYTYEESPEGANLTYTGKAFYITGYIPDLYEPKPGTYESCYAPNSSPGYNCPKSDSNSGFVIWIWNGEQNADQVTSGSTVTVECVIQGYSGGNLTLSYCSFSS